MASLPVLQLHNAYTSIPTSRPTMTLKFRFSGLACRERVRGFGVRLGNSQEAHMIRKSLCNTFP